MPASAGSALSSSAREGSKVVHDTSGLSCLQVDALQWRQALAAAGGERNPKHLWPVLAVGYKDLVARKTAQVHRPASAEDQLVLRGPPTLQRTCQQLREATSTSVDQPGASASHQTADPSCTRPGYSRPARQLAAGHWALTPGGCPGRTRPCRSTRHGWPACSRRSRSCSARRAPSCRPHWTRCGPPVTAGASAGVAALPGWGGPGLQLAAGAGTRTRQQPDLLGGCSTGPLHAGRPWRAG